MNLSTAARFAESCETLGIPAPPSIARGVELLAIAEAHEVERPHVHTLSMTPEEVRSFIEDRSARRHMSRTSGTGFQPGLNQFRERLHRDVAAAVMPELEDVVQQLQQRFQELAAPMMTAVRTYGFTLTTTSDDIINLDDNEATAAWRNARKSWEAIAPIVSLRKEMTEVFELRPNHHDLPPVHRGGDSPNLSVLFAAGDNWSLGSEYLARSSTSLDWFALAKGGLRLNSPREVDEKLKTRDEEAMSEKLREHNATAEQRKAEHDALATRLNESMRTGRMSVAR